jgi:hypothetical protein
MHVFLVPYIGMPGLRNITAIIDFQRGNKTIYTTAGFVGYVGALTGVRPGGWAITVNERDRDGEGNIIDSLVAMLKGGNSIGFFLRQTLEDVNNFQDAIAKLQHTKLIVCITPIARYC